MAGPASVLRWAWYPTLLAVVFVVEPFTETAVGFAFGVRPLAIAAAIGIAVTVVATRLLGRDHGGAAAGFIVVGLIAATSATRVMVIVAALALLLAEWAWMRRGTLTVRLPWHRITEALNAIMVVLLVIELGRAGALHLGAQSVAIPPQWSVATSSERPDIFVIVADGHARRDVQVGPYGPARDMLSPVLTAAGLVELPSSWANHALTRFSLSVLLNGRPMSELGQDLDAPADDNLAIAALGHSSAMHLLETAGYETVVISSGYEHLGLNNADVLIDVGPRNEVEQTLLTSTAIGAAFDAMTDGFSTSARARMLGEIEAIKKRASISSTVPQFVFAHLPLPHWPYVLAADCSLRPADEYTLGATGRGNHAGDERSIAVVRDQTMCVDRLLADAVREIVGRKPDAVVIVMSDHGPEERLDWLSPDEPGLRERMANLFWARTPGRTGVFPGDVSLVNVFPLLLNAYFGAQIPTHRDDLFFGPTSANVRFVPYEPATP